MSNDKNVSKERHRWTKAERQYVQGIIHNYSLQRWTDQDIVNFLWQEKKIRIGRSTITTIKNKAEKEAEKWYISLRGSSAKYIAIYKDRLDSLLSYQKKLHAICDKWDSSPELVLRAISELHRIEISLHTLMKELPGDIKTSLDVEEEEKTSIMTFDEWRYNIGGGPRVSGDEDYSDEENGQYYWDLHKKYNEYVSQQGQRISGSWKRVRTPIFR
jgi:hypothetical protein